MKTKILLVPLLLALVANTNAQNSKEAVAAKVERAINNPGSITPELLRDPANADLLEALRKRAVEGHPRQARVLLLNAEDPPTLQLCLNEFHTEHWHKQMAVAQAFALCSQPRLILRFVNDLNLEESAQSKTVTGGEEVTRYRPVSVLAAFVIQGIISHSPQFRGELKQWAQSLHPDGRDAEREAARSEIRTWLQENQQFLNAGKYDQVKLPSHTQTASPVASP